MINNFSTIRKYNIEGFNDFQILLTQNNYKFNLCFLTNYNSFINLILKYTFLNKNIFFYFHNVFLYNIFNYINNKNLSTLYFSNSDFNQFKTRRSSIFMLNYKFIDHRRYFNIIFKDLTYTILDSLSMHTLIRQRYGVGSKIANLLCKFLGISSRFKTSNLPVSSHYSKLSTFFSNNLDNLDNNLMNYNLNRHTESIQLKTYKGFRLLKGYPSNGQRTRSNHKTPQRKPYKFSFYYI
jgi:ribosomal protein S13